MTVRVFCKNAAKLLLLIAFPLLCFTSCYTQKDLAYYADETNYIRASGTVSHIAYTGDREELYLAFSDLSEGFDDVNFKIAGESLAIVQERGIDEKLQIGDTVTFSAAPLYPGDGYVIPIAEIVIDGETLLEFTEGFDSIQKWLKTQ